MRTQGKGKGLDIAIRTQGKGKDLDIAMRTQGKGKRPRYRNEENEEKEKNSTSH
jgi:hypothetical protein